MEIRDCTYGKIVWRWERDDPSETPKKIYGMIVGISNLYGEPVPFVQWQNDKGYKYPVHPNNISEA